MKIELTVKEERQIKREIDLPFFSKDPCSFTMITMDERIVIVNDNGDTNLTDAIEIIESNSIHYETTLIRTIEAKQISESEFIKKYDKIINKIIHAIGTRHQPKNSETNYNPEDLTPLPEGWVDPLP